jgi:hypothetical protein
LFNNNEINLLTEEHISCLISNKINIILSRNYLENKDFQEKLNNYDIIVIDRINNLDSILIKLDILPMNVNNFTITHKQILIIDVINTFKSGIYSIILFNCRKYNCNQDNLLIPIYSSTLLNNSRIKAVKNIYSSSFNYAFGSIVNNKQKIINLNYIENNLTSLKSLFWTDLINFYKAKFKYVINEDKSFLYDLSYVIIDLSTLNYQLTLLFDLFN